MKGISHLVAHFLSRNTNKYYYKMLSYGRETALQGALVFILGSLEST